MISNIPSVFGSQAAANPILGALLKQLKPLAEAGHVPIEKISWNEETKTASLALQPHPTVHPNNVVDVHSIMLIMGLIAHVAGTLSVADEQRTFMVRSVRMTRIEGLQCQHLRVQAQVEVVGGSVTITTMLDADNATALSSSASFSGIMVPAHT